MKKTKGVKLWTKVDGKLVGEEWVTCRDFAAEIGRSYHTVLKWLRKKWLPVIELGERRYVNCITPRVRALRIYRELQKSGPLRAPRR